MTLPLVSGEFTLGQDPDIRFTPSGMAVASCRAVASSRKKQDDGTWVDDKSAWVTLTAFKQLAENIAETLQKGMKVTVTGRLEIQEWTDKDDNKRITPAVLLDSIGPSLAFATAKVSKVERSGGGGNSGGGQAAASDDPWATTPASTNKSDDPPF